MIENWKCAKCNSLNHPRRKKCWKCNSARFGWRIPKRVDLPWIGRVSTIGVAGASATLCALLFAGLALIPGFWQLFFHETLPEKFLSTSTPVPSLTPRPTGTLSPTSTMTPEPPLQLDFLNSGYEPSASSMLLLPGEPSNADPEDQVSQGGISLRRENRIVMSVLNQSNTTIVINNQVPIQLIAYQPMQSPVNVLNLPLGGEGFYRNFVADIPMNAGSGTVWASFSESGV